MKLKRISDQVIVITGASSGIGLATARMAAQMGARLVLAARNEQALADLTNELRQHGTEAEYVVADVGVEREVLNIVRTAHEAFGGFDTWINNAGIGIYGRLLEVTTEDHRRLIDTNFWGIVYGSLAAARAIGKQKRPYGAAIINLGSEVSDRALPLVGMYSASKHAVKGFTDALRMELEEAHYPISVSLVKPGATDTPFPQHAKNYLDQEPMLPSPVYVPEVVAEVILHCAQTPVREIFASGSAKAHSLQSKLMPRVMDWLMEGLYFSRQKSGKPANRSDDALYTPTTGLRERGNAQGHVRKWSASTKADMHPLATWAVLAGTGLSLYALAKSLSTTSKMS